MSRDFIVNTKSCGTIIKRTRTPILSDYAKNLEKLKLPAAHSMQDMESSWSQLEHRFDAWVSFYTVSLEDGPSPKSIFLRANPLASTSAFNSSLILEAFKRSLLSLLWSGSSRFDGFMIYFAIFSFTKIQGRHPVVIKSIPCYCQSSWLKMPSTNSFVLQYILPLYIVTTYRLKLTFPSLSAQFFSFFSLFINNRRYPEEPYSRVFSVITWTTYKNTVNYDRRCSTRVKWCGSICFVYIHATPTWRIATVVKQLVTWVKPRLLQILLFSERWQMWGVRLNGNYVLLLPAHKHSPQNAFSARLSYSIGCRSSVDDPLFLDGNEQSCAA